MSLFIDQSILESRWGAPRVDRLAGEAMPSGGSKAAEITRAIDAAESLTVSLLKPRYGDDLPATPDATPEVLQNLVSDLAIYELARHHEFIGEDLLRAQRDALALLRSIARGGADLGLATAPTSDSTTAQILTTKTKSDMVFGNGGLDEW